MEEAPQGQLHSGEWNGDKAYGEERGDEGEGIIAAGEKGTQGRLLFSFTQDYYWIEASE